MSDVSEIAELLFGGGADELIRKMNPDSADLATHDRKKRALTAGLSAVGATAGAAGLGLAAVKTHGAYKEARVGVKGLKAAKHLSGGSHRAPVPGMNRKDALKSAVKHEKLATGLIPLEVAGLGGELMATKILHGDAKKKLVKKDLSDIPTNKRALTMTAMNSTPGKKGISYTKKKGKGVLQKLPNPITTQVEKSADVDVIWSGDIAKANTDKQQIFGWASVVEVNGEPVVDLQGDRISPAEMEKAAYTYVQKSRKGGDMHLADEWEPVQKSEMIESFIVTDEKREAMGLPDSVPTGWWVGFQVQDPDVWAKVKSGERTGFSIHGKGRREAIS